MNLFFSSTLNYAWNIKRIPHILKEAIPEHSQCSEEEEGEFSLEQDPAGIAFLDNYKVRS